MCPYELFWLDLIWHQLKPVLYVGRRCGFRIGEQNGGKKRTPRKDRGDQRTTPTRPRVAASPWTPRRSRGGSCSAWRRRNESRSASCCAHRASFRQISCTRPARTATAVCLRAPTARRPSTPGRPLHSTHTWPRAAATIARTFFTKEPAPLPRWSETESRRRETLPAVRLCAPTATSRGPLPSISSAPSA